jgi:propanol-preferring alcohol dehydrogenase
MKAALLEAIGKRLRVGQAPAPTIGPQDVLIATRTCGICRTDLHIQDGLAYIPQLPHIPGHEPAGVVCEVGQEVDDVRVGDRVVPHLFLTCGKCRYCRTGRESQCSHVAGILGVTTSGGFAEYFKAPARNLLKLPDEVPFDVGGLTSCAIITAVHAYRRVRIEVGEPVVVLGIGGIGQILIQVLKHAGARIAAISRSADSLRIANSLGAELCLLSGEETAKKVVEFSEGEGVACVFECVGGAATMKAAAGCARRGGQIVVIGEEPEFPAIDTICIAQRELEIIGSRNGSKQDAVDALRWIAEGVIQPPIAERIPLEDINEGLAKVRAGTVHGRVVVTTQEA